MNLDKELFSGKNLSNLFEEIYSNSKETKNQINNLILELKDLIDDIDDASRAIPLIKEYLEIGVKNNEHLIKLATVIQRLESAEMKGGKEGFDYSELENLLEDQTAIEKEIKDIKKLPNKSEKEDDSESSKEKE